MTSVLRFAQPPFYKCSKEHIELIFNKLAEKIAFAHCPGDYTVFTNEQREENNHQFFWDIPIESSDGTSHWSIGCAYRVCSSPEHQALEHNRKVFIAASHPFYLGYGFEALVETPEELLKEVKNMALKIWDLGLSEMCKKQREKSEVYKEDCSEPEYLGKNLKAITKTLSTREFASKSNEEIQEIIKKFQIWANAKYGEMFPISQINFCTLQTRCPNKFSVNICFDYDIKAFRLFRGGNYDIQVGQSLIANDHEELLVGYAQMVCSANAMKREQEC